MNDSLLRHVRLLLVLAVLTPPALVPAIAAEEVFRPEYLNLDFESHQPLEGWFAGGRGYVAELDTAITFSGRHSLHLRYESPGDFGVGTSSFPVAPALEKTVQYTGYVKTRGVSEGYAGLWWRVDDERQTVLAFDNMSGRGIVGDSDWQKVEIVLHVPHTATNINFGVLLTGQGEAWFDALEVRLGGELYTQTEPPPPTPPAEAVVAWLRERVHAFETVEAGHGFEDLRFLDDLVGDARIVALGEVTHGSRDIFQMKHRILEYLVMNHGFRLFAIEANLPEAYRVNDYVLSGEGDPRALLSGMYFWTWDTQEVLDMIEWMRSFNESLAEGEEPVQFLGFDMQYPQVAEQNIRSFMEQHDAEFVPRLESVLQTLDKLYTSNRSFPAKFGKDEALLELTWKRLTQRLDARDDAYVAAAGAEAVTWLHQNVRVLRQCLDLVVVRAPHHRDESMAQNAAWILDQAGPDARIVLWAHNYHVSRTPGAMGHALAEIYGDQLVVFGFSFHEGRYTAMAQNGRLTHHQARASSPGSVEDLMHRTGIERFVVDLRSIPEESPVGPWIHGPTKMRSTGALAEPYGFADTVIAEAYDVLVFLDRTAATRSLRRDFEESGR